MRNQFGFWFGFRFQVMKIDLGFQWKMKLVFFLMDSGHPILRLSNDCPHFKGPAELDIHVFCISEIVTNALRVTRMLTV